MKPYTFYRQYSLNGIRRKQKIPSKEDLPEKFVDLIEKMGFDIEDSPFSRENCLGISKGPGTSFFARIDFNEGIVYEDIDENILGRIKPLGLEELPLRSILFNIPDTHGGGSMRYESEINERIPRFRDYLKIHSFKIIYKNGAEVKNRFVKKRCGELFSGSIIVFPYEPWGEVLTEICKEYE